MLQAKHQIRRKKQERTMMQQIEYAICEWSATYKFRDVVWWNSCYIIICRVHYDI